MIENSRLTAFNGNIGLPVKLGLTVKPTQSLTAFNGNEISEYFSFNLVKHNDFIFKIGLTAFNMNFLNYLSIYLSLVKFNLVKRRVKHHFPLSELNWFNGV